MSDTISLLDNGGRTDPAFNLALEEFLVREENDETVLFTYINDPSVVLGKHQNVLQEANLDSARKAGVRIVRRISGGGAVYHDRGNLNVAIIHRHEPKHHNNYARLLDPLVRFMAGHGVRARINNRNSLVLDDERKFSGSAQFVSRGRMMSHATLLFDADLELLQDLLTPGTPVSQSHAVESVRSRVVNLAPLLPQYSSIAELSAGVVAAFAPEGVRHRRLTTGEIGQVEELVRSRYGTWSWTIGRSPKFVLHLQSATGDLLAVTVREGIIDSVSRTDRGTSPGDQLCGRKIDEVLFGSSFRVVPGMLDDREKD